MKKKSLLLAGLALLALIGVVSTALARTSSAAPSTIVPDPDGGYTAQATPTAAMADAMRAATLPEVVRKATVQFKDGTEKAEKAGYALLHGCVSGPQEGAMGIHYANGKLVGDGALDARYPEALLYEPTKGGKMQLVGVEYVVLADDWQAKNSMPPVLMGQLFNYVGAPNRYGLPPFYELHVWAWKSNPSGVFSDWNPRVSCEDFTGAAMGSMSH